MQLPHFSWSNKFYSRVYKLRAIAIPPRFHYKLISRLIKDKKVHTLANYYYIHTFSTNSEYKNNLCMSLLANKNMHHFYKRQRVSINSDLSYTTKKRENIVVKTKRDPHKTTEFLSFLSVDTWWITNPEATLLLLLCSRL